MNNIIDLPDVKSICLELINFIKEDYEAAQNNGNEDMLNYDSSKYIFEQFYLYYTTKII
jgi:hypothetical protein